MADVLLSLSPCFSACCCSEGSECFQFVGWRRTEQADREHCIFRTSLTGFVQECRIASPKCNAKARAQSVARRRKAATRRRALHNRGHRDDLCETLAFQHLDCTRDYIQAYSERYTSSICRKATATPPEDAVTASPSQQGNSLTEDCKEYPHVHFGENTALTEEKTGIAAIPKPRSNVTVIKMALSRRPHPVAGTVLSSNLSSQLDSVASLTNTQRSIALLKASLQRAKLQKHSKPAPLLPCRARQRTTGAGNTTRKPDAIEKQVSRRHALPVLTEPASLLQATPQRREVHSHSDVLQSCLMGETTAKPASLAKPFRTVTRRECFHSAGDHTRRGESAVVKMHEE